MWPQQLPHAVLADGAPRRSAGEPEEPATRMTMLDREIRLGVPILWPDLPVVVIPWEVRLSPWATWSQVWCLGLN